MYRKRFYVKIDLQLHAITCPGVWLCTHGYLEATIKTLGYYFRTGAMEPRFPLLCHDHYTMEGYFKSVGSIDELERVLAAEQVEITLWQNGRRLAYFLGKLSDVMHPGVPRLTCAHNVNVQLLMKASPAFPGIIAPKIELSAQVGIQDRLTRAASILNDGASETGSRCSKCCHGNFVIPNFALDTPRTQNRHSQKPMSDDNGFNCFNYLDEPRRQKPVCHSRATCANTSTQHTLSLACSNAKPFEGDSVAHSKNEQRRLSTCSSFFSSNSYNVSQTSCITNSCCHSLGTNSSGSAAGAHQQRCDICQSYKRLFSQ